MFDGCGGGHGDGHWNGHRNGRGTPEPAGAAAGPPDMAAHVGPAGWARLAPAVRWRFGAAQARQSRTYHGAMDLWRSPMGLAFALLGRLLGGPLPCRAGRAVPAVVQVRPDGAGMAWDRLLATGPGRCATGPGRCATDPGRSERVSSTKQTGPGGWLQERTSAGLVMELDVFEDRGALVFRSRRYLLQLGRRQVPIPALLTPGVCEVRHTDAGPGRFRFTLTAIHPVWGTTFRQDGLFHDPSHHPGTPLPCRGAVGG